jgi:hypothetical protein
MELPMVNEPAEDFELQGYIYATWHDDRLVLHGDDRSGEARTLDPEEVWNPKLDITNARTFKSFRRSFFCFPDGTVFWEERFNAVLSDEYYLRRFPFDKQSLSIVVQPSISPARPNEDPITFASSDYATSINPSAYLSAWAIKRITYSVDSVRTGNGGITIPQAKFDVLVRRRSGFYVWKVFLPIFLMTLVPWSVFWVSTSEFDWQMKIPIAIMLAMVAFDFSVSWDLPRLSYITFLDSVFLASFVFTFLSTVEVTVTHVLILREMRPLAEKIQIASRWLFPLAYVLLLLALLALFFSGPGRPS